MPTTQGTVPSARYVQSCAELIVRRPWPLAGTELSERPSAQTLTRTLNYPPSCFFVARHYSLTMVVSPLSYTLSLLLICISSCGDVTEG